MKDEYYEAAVAQIKEIKTNQELMTLINSYTITDEDIAQLVEDKLIEEVIVQINKNDYHYNKKYKCGAKDPRYYCIPKYVGGGEFAGYRYYRDDYRLTLTQVASRLKEKLMGA